MPFAGPEGVIAVLPLGLVLRGPEGLFRVEVVFVGGPEPGVKRAVSFVDGQNLYHHAKAAFGHPVPNYDPWALAGAVCQQRGFRNVGVRFYTGVPLVQKDPKWHGFWRCRLLRMRHHGIDTTERPLHYRRVQFPEPGGPKLIEIPQEKGIDVRISLDVVRLASEGDLDVAILFSQDQDFEEVAREIRRIAARQHRWIKIASAFPASPTATCRVGVRRTDWLRMDRSLYDSCLDPTDYFAAR